jgi:2-keto-4-pentenoate hydratase/2-oxohepta-3-ene-1,7-dioic acid hydratase in catechol pathway
MKLATLRRNGALHIGVIIGPAGQERVIDAGPGDMREFIANWSANRVRLKALVASSEGDELADTSLAAPVVRPGKIFAIGLNYADHIAESNMELPKEQVWFAKASTSANGPFDPVLASRTGPYVDYEAELVAVIGKAGKHIPADQAADHVFGYCVGNDVTERAWQHRTPQWTLGKSFDTHAPMGPWITTADEVSDPHDLELRCKVNGEIRQASNTHHMVFSIWDQIAHLSQAMTLEPGDIIFTGTPSGIGAVMKPPRFLKPGDQVRVEIDGLGAIQNTIAAER